MFIWADELCAWRKSIAWDMAQFGLRLGPNPSSFVSTTPKPTKLIKDLIADSGTVLTRGSTYSNIANLSPKFIEKIIKKFEGTSLGRQELEGLLIEQSEGALWTRQILEETRCYEIPDGLSFVRIVVAVDPAISSNVGQSNLTGIIVCGLGYNGQGYVLADYSGTFTPAKWAHKVNLAYNTWQADRVVAEGNQGGEMVRHTIHSVNKDIPVKIVHASRGKVARAEPISAKFEQGQAHIVGALADLEDQLCTWEPLSGDGSPDRLDAMVWGLTDCLIGQGHTSQDTVLGFY
jgi:phage terminase large subunit-like protein